MEIHTVRMQGLGIRKVAALLGISRNAVRRALRSAAPPSGETSAGQRRQTRSLP